MNESEVRSELDGIVLPLVARDESSLAPALGCLTSIALFLLLWLAFGVSWPLTLLSCIFLGVLVTIVDASISSWKLRAAAHAFLVTFRDDRNAKDQAVAALLEMKTKTAQRLHKQIQQKERFYIDILKKAAKKDPELLKEKLKERRDNRP